MVNQQLIERLIEERKIAISEQKTTYNKIKDLELEIKELININHEKTDAINGFDAVLLFYGVDPQQKE